MTSPREFFLSRLNSFGNSSPKEQRLHHSMGHIHELHHSHSQASLNEALKLSLNDLKKKVVADKRFTVEEAERARQFHKSMPGYKPSELCDMKYLAEYLGISKLWIKDESSRFGLKAYKVLGSAFALAKMFHATSWDDLVVKVQKARPKFVTATDGNHGCGVAYLGEKLQCPVKVYMPKGTVPERVERISRFGANVEVLEDHNYDGCIDQASADAKKKDWTLIQDSTLVDYETIPLHIMQGYMTIMSEVWEQFKGSDEPTHVFLQAGVGSFAGGMAGYLTNKQHKNFPKIIVVEPRGADCYYRSHQVGDGNLHTMQGFLETVMAGLNCGTPSSLGWPILRDNAEAFLSCKDSVSFLGMRVLNSPLEGDPRIISGESGAVPAGALYKLCRDPRYGRFREDLGLDAKARVLIISTEGDTDPDGFRKGIWEESPLT